MFTIDLNKIISLSLSLSLTIALCVKCWTSVQMGVTVMLHHHIGTYFLSTMFWAASVFLSVTSKGVEISSFFVIL